MSTETVNRRHAVIVMQIPEVAGDAEVLSCTQELRKCMEGVGRPRVVLDCMAVTEMGRHTIRLLLGCLEEAIKRNGDARLAGLSPSAEAILGLFGIDRLFRIFPSTADGIESFDRLPKGGILNKYVVAGSRQPSGDFDTPLSSSSF